MKEFMLGTNYWASHAGTEMWRNWNEDVIRQDFEILSAHGAKYLRVFPIWRDFQPVNPMLDGHGKLREYRVNDDKLPENVYYLDETMLARFEKFCDIAEEYGMKLIVGIITGWMSGRLFIPPVLYGKNLFTDPVALMFEMKFIEGFVKRVKDKPAIYSWDLGNECNCMSDVPGYEAAEAWTGIISNAIRANDPTRDIVSGMHGISTESNWRISSQAHYTDMLTTHPYPYFVPHCTTDTYSSMRTLLHATCETKLYSDLGHKPCLVEEIGTLGPMMCDDNVAASFLRVNMFSNWAHGSPGVLWWCANDQDLLETPPYCWNMCEVELGMITSDRKPKPVLKEMKEFSQWVNGLDFELPAASEDAVCILTTGQDNWGIAYMSGILAKQAKVNIKYAYAPWELPESDTYLLPSVFTVRMMPSYTFNELKKRVYNGATLYLSAGAAVVSGFNELTGVVINDSKTSYDGGTFEVNGRNMPYRTGRKFYISENGAEVLSRDSKGVPIFTKYSYGKGTVYYVNFPMEQVLMESQDAHNSGYYEIYRTVFAHKIKEHIADSDCVRVGITHHYTDDGAYIVMINYSGEDAHTSLTIKPGYETEKVICGDPYDIKPYDTCILKVRKK